MEKREMNERIVKEMTLEERMKKNKNIALAITGELSEILNRKVDWCVDGDNVAEFHIYKNNYDYDVVKIKLLTQDNWKYLETYEYIEIIKYMLLERGLKNNLYNTHKAPTIEKVIVDMFEECKDNDFYIMNGLLCHQGADLFDLSEIEEFHFYNGEDMILTLYEDGVKYLILFNENRVEEVE